MIYFNNHYNTLYFNRANFKFMTLKNYFFIYLSLCFFWSCEKEKIEQPIQVETPTPLLSFPTKKLNFKADGDTVFLEIISNIPWKLEMEKMSFLIVDKLSGNGKDSIRIEAQQNQEQIERQTKLFLKSALDGVQLVDSVILTQFKAKENPAEDELNPDQDNILSSISKINLLNNVGNFSFDIDATCNWNVKLKHGLFTIYPQEGVAGKHKLTLKYLKNEMGRTKIDTLIFMKEGQLFPLLKIPIEQSAEILSFTIELLYNGVLLTDELVLPSYRKSSKSLNLNVQGNYNRESIYVRNLNKEEPCWAAIKSIFSQNINYIYKDGPPCTLDFEENTGAERIMFLEFFDQNHKTHKIVRIVQPTTERYLSLSESNLAMDKFGTIYDFPKALSIESNIDWEVKTTEDWLNIKNEQGKRNQVAFITVMENTTGSSRTGSLQFWEKNSLIKEIFITQSQYENSTFNLKYELNFTFITDNNQFEYSHPLTKKKYYPNLVEIYDIYGSNDKTIKKSTDAIYGFVTDYPTSFNKLIITNFRDPLFIYRNYSGQSATLDRSTAITITNKSINHSFFRQLGYVLPIPSKIHRNQKIIYTIEINNIHANQQHDIAKISYKIVNQ